MATAKAQITTKNTQKPSKIECAARPIDLGLPFKNRHLSEGFHWRRTASLTPTTAAHPTLSNSRFTPRFWSVRTGKHSLLRLAHTKLRGTLREQDPSRLRFSTSCRPTSRNRGLMGTPHGFTPPPGSTMVRLVFPRREWSIHCGWIEFESDIQQLIMTV